MCNINLDYLEKCICELEAFYTEFKQTETPTSLHIDIVLRAYAKTLELCAKLLQKKLAPFLVSKKAVDALTFKDVFRTAFKHSLLDETSVLRWLQYRNYADCAEAKDFNFINNFIADAKSLQKVIHG